MEAAGVEPSRSHSIFLLHDILQIVCQGVCHKATSESTSQALSVASGSEQSDSSRDANLMISE